MVFLRKAVSLILTRKSRSVRQEKLWGLDNFNTFKIIATEAYWNFISRMTTENLRETKRFCKGVECESAEASSSDLLHKRS